MTLEPKMDTLFRACLVGTSISTVSNRLVVYGVASSSVINGH